MQLQDPVSALAGIGPAAAQRFAKLGVRTLEDLICLYPRDYWDLTRVYGVGEAPFGVCCPVRATVRHISSAQRLSGGRHMVRVVAGDDTAQLILTYFNPYISRILHEGEEVLFRGTFDGSLTRRQAANPDIVELSWEGKMMPIYPQTAGLASRTILRHVQRALQALQPIEDPLPPAVVQHWQLGSLQQALRDIHAPTSDKDLRHARRRLAYQELFFLQLGMALLRGRRQRANAAPVHGISPQPFLAQLPFRLTGAQQRAIACLQADMGAKTPMNRLLQGDVGSGKTVVAAAAIYMAATAGFQSVLMAPTEILAGQHAGTLEGLLGGMGIHPLLLSGAVQGRRRAEALRQIASGSAQLVVGTHAVLGAQVQFADLGLAVTDEQHRFGVRQRAELAAKGVSPHLLVMSATPIPRTMGLLLYGDLDITVLDELPPGRQPVKTLLTASDKRARMYAFVDKQLAAGRQAYIVCPAIEESEGELESVTSYCRTVAGPLLPGRRIGLLHGRMRPAEKAAVMQEFAAGRLDVLCSTTVIEVGVDVPNATVMVVENAERYGLSTLHQLRGRVGRGAQQSWCILVSDHDSEETRRRLAFLRDTTDGFAVAQFDLDTRGPGDFLGQRQHGLPTLRLADLVADAAMMNCARDDAHALLRQDPQLRAHPLLDAQVQRMFARAEVLN